MNVQTSNRLVDLAERIRRRAIRSNDVGAVPIWELAQNTTSNGGNAA